MFLDEEIIHIWNTTHSSNRVLGLMLSKVQNAPETLTDKINAFKQVDYSYQLACKKVPELKPDGWRNHVKSAAERHGIRKELIELLHW